MPLRAGIHYVNSKHICILLSAGMLKKLYYCTQIQNAKNIGKHKEAKKFLKNVKNAKKAKNDLVHKITYVILIFIKLSRNEN